MPQEASLRRAGVSTVRSRTSTRQGSTSRSAFWVGRPLGSSRALREWRARSEMCPPLRAQRPVSALRQAEIAVSDLRLRRPTRDDRSIFTSADLFRIDDGLAAAGHRRLRPSVPVLRAAARRHRRCLAARIDRDLAMLPELYHACWRPTKDTLRLRTSTADGLRDRRRSWRRLSRLGEKASGR
jgi:hypothetical protein